MMKTVHEVSRLTGISVRALQYYDKIGLLAPSAYTDAGYRLYDDDALLTLQQIMLFRELEFPLSEIKRIISSPDFDRDLAITQQITLLTLKKERLEKIISYANKIRAKGADTMDFTPFDTKKLDEYAQQAKKAWGNTAEYREYEERTGGGKNLDRENVAREFMALFKEFGAMKDADPSSNSAAAQVRKLQSYITDHFYTCSDEILLSLADMYDGGGEMTENIDKAGDAGTAEFAAKAIRSCLRKS